MKKTETKIQKKRPLAQRLFLYFALFALVMLLFNWLFQSVFLDGFYRAITINKSSSAMKQLETSLKTDAADSDTLEAISSEYDICVTVYGRGMSTVFAHDAMVNCIIHHMSRFQLQSFYAKAQQGGGNYSETISYVMGPSLPIDGRDERQILESVLIVRIIEIDGTEYVIFLNAQITPVNAVTETINLLLLIVTGLMIGIASLLAWMISRSVAKPIKNITYSAMQLATGDYSAQFDTTSRYRELAQLGKTLNYAATELSKVDKLRTELIANVSHDLRTPLTLIGGYGEVMRDIPGENTPENAQIIVDEAKRLSTIVTDVLDLSKLESGVEKLEKTDFCITSTIDSILKSYRSLSISQGYEIEFQKNDAELWVRADEVKICRVIYNILNNAISFTGDDKRIGVYQTAKGPRVRIAISDSGRGIPKEELPRIFDRYYKVASDRKNTVQRGGSGLGLSIVKIILDLHSAPFGIISGNTGTTVWFELDSAEPAQE